MDEKQCKNCVWYDQCGSNKACEDYCPISEEESEEYAISAYEQELRIRHELYTEQINEQS